MIAALACVTIKPALTLATAAAWSLLAAFYIPIPETHYLVLSLVMIACTPVAVAAVGVAKCARGGAVGSWGEKGTARSGPTG